MIPAILYQDDDILVLDKPSGMVVNRAESVKGETVEEWIGKNSKFKIQNSECIEKDEYSDFISRAGIVHRIDKETSGILLAAKNPKAFIELQRQFKEREVKKTYLALVHGTMSDEGEIRAPVGRLPWNREHFGIVPGGKEAVTRFKKIQNSEFRIPAYAKASSFTKVTADRSAGKQIPSSKAVPLSLCEVYPETGRTHQIRVHFKYIGHPLVGDYLYAGRKQGRDDRMWAPRVMLHAWKISFTHPATGKPLAYEAPIPDDVNRIINESSSANYE